VRRFISWRALLKALDITLPTVMNPGVFVVEKLYPMPQREDPMPDTTSAPTPAAVAGRPLIRSWRRALGYGFLLWLVPFIAAVGLFPIRQSNRPLFESIMPIVLAVCTMLALKLYLRRGAAPAFGEGLLLGLIWMAVSLLFDWPMFSAGPMKMTLGGYMSDIGAAYLLFPVLTVGAGFLLRGTKGDM
jgi:hypothetical protein